MTANSGIISATEQSHPQKTAWYVLYCHLGSENQVGKRLRQRLKQANMADQLSQIMIIPDRQAEPGYILLEMALDARMWDLVRHTAGVTGFVGADHEPTPLEQPDVDKILRYVAAKKAKPALNLNVGQPVHVIEGPFEDCMGLVEAIDLDRGRVQVLVDFVGRETLVELNFSQVKPTTRAFG